MFCKTLNFHPGYCFLRLFQMREGSLPKARPLNFSLHRSFHSGGTAIKFWFVIDFLWFLRSRRLLSGFLSQHGLRGAVLPPVLLTLSEQGFENSMVVVYSDRWPWPSLRPSKERLSMETLVFLVEERAQYAPGGYGWLQL